MAGSSNHPVMQVGVMQVGNVLVWNRRSLIHENIFETLYDLRCRPSRFSPLLCQEPAIGMLSLDTSKSLFILIFLPIFGIDDADRARCCVGHASALGLLESISHATALWPVRVLGHDRLLSQFWLDPLHNYRQARTQCGCPEDRKARSALLS